MKRLLLVAWTIIHLANLHAQIPNTDLRTTTTKLPLVSQQDLSSRCRCFWDHYDFQDLKPLQSPRVILDYIYLLSIVPQDTARNCLQDVLNRAIKNQSVFEQFIFLFDRYLYNPNSKFQNEELYLPILEYVIQSPRVDSIYKIYPRAQLRLIRQNRIGHKANDFPFVLSNGTTMRLYEIESPYTLLYFNNPDCSICDMTQKQICESTVINYLQRQGRLQIIAIYPGNQVDLWQQKQYPITWINGYDDQQIIYAKWLYALKTMPALYLLDWEKKVLVKERPIADIEQYLKSAN